MTVLTGIPKYPYASPSAKRSWFMHDLYQGLQHRSITHTLIAWIAGAVLTYLIAVYSLFGLSVTLQQQSGIFKELTEANTITELSLQQKQTEFARNNEDILQSMEKISDMRYLLPANTSVSRAEMSDKVNQ